MINCQIIVLGELPNKAAWKRRVALDGRNNYYFPLHLQLLQKTKLFLSSTINFIALPGIKKL